ncbi:ABC transporter permease [Fontimonas sp. SYSU GA230001]|uniref:ABC transporter permease n=1 Tax=Fontimonas sp. SYSU GA230001 TaxID=3142450 RepID=UPI0032B48B6E
MNLYADIALSHLSSRRRQTVASLAGVVVGVAFFLAVSSLMRGSERDFIRRLVDTAPHITVSDEFRTARTQPAVLAYPQGAVHIARVKPPVDRRGIRQYAQRLALIDALPDLRAAPVLVGQVILSFGGRDEAVSLTGIEPARMAGVSTIDEDIVAGSLKALDIDPNGILVGRTLADELSLGMNDTLSVVAPGGAVRTLRIVGLFDTGNVNYDRRQTFARLKRVQALLNRPDAANSIIVKLDDPYRAREVATHIEKAIGYKSVSWQEASQNILNTLMVRNIIMYSVISAILVVASFGIYTVISTVVMERTRDIAILKSMGFHAADIRRIFVIEGIVIGLLGSLLGCVGGSALMWVAQQTQVTVPGQATPVNLPIYWGADQFALSAFFALLSAVAASYLPARKGGAVQPVDILRGAA